MLSWSMWNLTKATAPSTVLARAAGGTEYDEDALAEADRVGLCLCDEDTVREAEADGDPVFAQWIRTGEPHLAGGADGTHAR